MKFRKKPVVVEAITFEELVAHGLANGANVVNGMPWSFDYNGNAITHENDECYLIPTIDGTMKMQRGDMLITGTEGEIYPCKPDSFAATYVQEDAMTYTTLQVSEATMRDLRKRFRAAGVSERHVRAHERLGSSLLIGDVLLHGPKRKDDRPKEGAVPRVHGVRRRH